MKRVFKYGFRKILLCVATTAGSAFLFAVYPQDPGKYDLPNVKGAWKLVQVFQTGMDATGLKSEMVIVLSNGSVFYSRIVGPGLVVKCDAKFTPREMEGVRTAIANAPPGGWRGAAGPTNVLNMRSETYFVSDGKGNYSQNRVFIERSSDAGVIRVAEAMDDAGRLTFSRCGVAGGRSTGAEEKIEHGIPLYAVTNDGDLFWYNHTDFQNGEPVFANNGVGKKIDTGWLGMAAVFKGDPRGTDGIFYTVTDKGEMQWHNYKGHASGSDNWSNGTAIGSGFNTPQVFSGGNGIIYWIDRAGDLYWYKHLAYLTGEKTWANNGIGKKIASGWGNNRFVFSDGNGVIYKLDNRGDLYWTKHLGFQTGSAQWQNPVKIASGWFNFSQVFSGGDGIIYALTTDKKLGWFRHLGNATGADTWANNGKMKVNPARWNAKFLF